MRYADDTVLLTCNLHDTQHLLEKLNDRYNEYGLKINFQKTKLIVVTQFSQDPCEPDGGKHHDREYININLGTWIEQSRDKIEK